MASEHDRIAFLSRRDGPERTAAWVRRTLQLYREALADPSSHAAQPDYRPRFEEAVREFEAWLSRYPEETG